MPVRFGGFRLKSSLVNLWEKNNMRTEKNTLIRSILENLEYDATLRGWVCSSASYSDYSGSSVEVANSRVLEGMGAQIYRSSFSGSCEAYYVARNLFRLDLGKLGEIDRALSRLSDYPCLDDDLLGEVENDHLTSCLEGEFFDLKWYLQDRLLGEYGERWRDLIDAILADIVDPDTGEGYEWGDWVTANRERIVAEILQGRQYHLEYSGGSNFSLQFDDRDYLPEEFGAARIRPVSGVTMGGSRIQGFILV